VDSATFFGAAKSGHIETVKLALMQNQIDMKIIDEGHPAKHMALIHACVHGHENIVELLLGLVDIQVNKCSKGEASALQCACRQGYVNIVKLLLERKDIQVNLRSKLGWTPLMLACLRRNEEVVELLLQRKDIQVNIQNGYGGTALMFACKEGYERAVTLLLDRDDIDTTLKDDDRKTAYDKCSRGISDAVKAHLKERMG
jgi:ankyrin repeat protein